MSCLLVLVWKFRLDPSGDRDHIYFRVLESRAEMERRREGMAITKAVIAIFDGEVLRPQEPLDLPPNTRVRLTVETEQPPSGVWGSSLDLAASLELDGPPDWSENLDDYLYGGKPFE